MFVQPILFSRYTTYTLPLYLILMAIGFEMVTAPVKRWAYVAALVAISFHVLLVTKNQYAVTVKLDQPREVVGFVVEKNAELRVGNARYLTNFPSLIQFYMRSNGIAAPLLYFVEVEDIGAKLGAAAKGDLFWIVVDGWDPHPRMLPYLAARYDKLAEARFQRGYAGLYRVR